MVSALNRIRSLVFVTIAGSAMFVISPSPVLSSEGGDSGGEFEEPIIRPRPEGGFTNPDTSSITADISNSTSLCLTLPKEYRVDCLAQELKETSRIVRKAGYRDANRQLNSASQKLSRLVRQNEDRAAPKIRRGGKTYRAVKKTAVKKVNRQAAKIIVETKTKLIRSASNSAAKKVHYARIAKAVDSTKVLLRSA